MDRWVELDRDRLSEQLEGCVDEHAVTVVTAPAGFGKSTALARWQAVSTRTIVPVRSSSSGAVQLPDGLVGDSGSNAGSPAVVLVVDDADRIAASELRELIDVVDANGHLRLVLASRRPAPVPLQRGAQSGRIALVSSDHLAFTVGEVSEVAERLGRPLAVHDALMVHAVTGGWPAAVRSELQRRGAPDRAVTAGGVALSLTDYIAEEVVDQLPPELVQFVLEATTCAEIDADLAIGLTGRPAAAAQLRECLHEGLFLVRHERADGSSAYGWHPTFAARCAAILRDRDPVRARDVQLRAAGLLRAGDPLQAMTLALRAGEPSTVAAIVSEQWVRLLLESREAQLEAVCTSLPLPWSEQPELLLARACCRLFARDLPESAALRRRAVVASRSLDEAGRARFELLLADADLLLAADTDALMQACDRAVAVADRAGELPPNLRSCGVFLLGWAEMRLRRDSPHAAALLREAAATCRAQGMEWIAQRATAYEAIVLAFLGEFDAALECHPAGPGRNDVSEAAAAAIDGALGLAYGFLRFWRNELDDSRAAFEMALAMLDQPPAEGSLSYVFLGFIAAAGRDPKALAEAYDNLDNLAPEGAFGLPWLTYRCCVEASLAEARGNPEQALEIARSFVAAERVPIVLLLLASVHLRCGDVDGARGRVGEVPAPYQQPYIRAYIALFEALFAAHEGRRDDAHRHLERALALAATQHVRRPFAAHADAVRELLEEHASWGTAHESFVVELLREKEFDRERPPVPVGELSPRELDVLRYMRTRMTADEMAAALFVSVNTVKTHQRAIYRKLGASGRRDALRIALARGLT